jgi:hypothetical protein
MYDFIIAGSGLTAFAALSELEESKSRILIIDYGIMPKKSNEELQRIDINLIKPNESKNFLGDDFSTSLILAGNIKKLNISNSYALGGLSNIWGCAVEEFDLDEFIDWPDINNGLSYGYKRLREKISLVSPLDLAKKDDFDLYYFNQLKNRKFKDIQIKKSVLAINKNLCKFCNECLYGCRHGATFNSKNYIEEQIKTKQIDYEGNIHIDFVKDGKEFSSVFGTSRDGKKMVFKGKKVLICMGAINTAKLFLNSFPDIKRIEVKDSQCFNMPIISKKLVGLNNNKESIALSQFVIKQKKILKNKSIHYQVYYPSLYTKNLIDSKLSFLPFRLPKYVKERVYVVQGYLPSDLSSSVSLSRVGQSIEASLSNSYSQIYLNYSINNISRIFSQSGFLPIKSLLNIMNPFSGYHFGSSLPMSNKSLNLSSTSTDLYGRLKSVHNIHVLDSSILPNIPAGSYSFTVMANAIRIVKSIKEKKI